MRDTFELFRRENRSIDIVTFDELLERAPEINSKGRSACHLAALRTQDHPAQ